MKLKLAISAAVILVASTAILGFNGGQETPTDDQGIKIGQHNQHTTNGTYKGQAMCNCPMMAQMSAGDKERMHQTQDRLESLVNTMESSSGERKTDATSSIVKILVEGRASMHKSMMASHTPMTAKTNGGDCNCPMMAQMTSENMRKMHETSARLDSLVNTMETSSGERKTDATASIAKILVEEGAAMHKRMMARN